MWGRSWRAFWNGQVRNWDRWNELVIEFSFDRGEKRILIHDFSETTYFFPSNRFMGLWDLVFFFFNFGHWCGGVYGISKYVRKIRGVHSRLLELSNSGTKVRGAIGREKRVKKQVLLEVSIDELSIVYHFPFVDHLVNDMILGYDFFIASYHLSGESCLFQETWHGP